MGRHIFSIIPRNERRFWALVQCLVIPFSVVALFAALGCSVSNSNEIVIPLPGEIKGRALVLVETASSNISINQDVVPPLITKVWWTTNLIVTENHPVGPRNKFPGDSYMVPDKSRSLWYLIDLQSGSVTRHNDYKGLTNKIEKLAGNLNGFKLMSLREAQKKRQDELGLNSTQ